MLGEAYVRRTYGKFRERYFPAADLPDFDEIDFAFEDAPGDWIEWGSFDWVDGVPVLRLHPMVRAWASILKGTLLHEMVHMVVDKNLGHGPKFWSEVDRINGLGAAREYF